jgi:structural maintenance of chromosome 4
VVGPNGSGKSNVIDAMLFVFGKKAQQLRHKNVSELIHHSEKFQNLDYCRVSVYFQEILDKVKNPRVVACSTNGDCCPLQEGDNAFDVIPNSNFVITRIGKKNNQSKYKINEKTSKRDEVEELLKSKGIDLDNNRFLILQVLLSSRLFPAHVLLVHKFFAYLFLMMVYLLG